MKRQPELPIYQASDIARLLNGEISDPRLAKDMLAAESDPQVQHFFDMLDLEAVLGCPQEEGGSGDPAISDAIRQRLAGLSRSRLFSLKLDGDPARLLAGESVQARVFADGGELDCRLAPSQDKGEYFLEMPKDLAGMRLLNITVGYLRLHEKCIPWSAANVAIDWSAGKLAAYHDAQVEVPDRRSLQSIEPLPAFAMHCATAKDAGPRILARVTSGDRLDIRCNARSGRELELAIVEICHPSTTTTHGDRKFRYPVCLERDQANPARGEFIADFVGGQSAEDHENQMFCDPASKEAPPDVVAEQRESLAFALRKLSPDLGKVLCLWMEGLGWTEIAHELRIPENTVRSRYDRAIAKVRKILANYLDKLDCPRSVWAVGCLLGITSDGEEVLMYQPNEPRKKPYVTSNGTKVCLKRADLESMKSMTLESALTLLERKRESHSSHR